MLLEHVTSGDAISLIPHTTTSTRRQNVKMTNERGKGTANAMSKREAI